MESERTSAAILFQGPTWSADQESVNLAPGMSLCRLEGSRVANLYQELCDRLGIDGGDPHAFQSYMLIDPASSSWYQSWVDSCSKAEHFYNLFTIMTASPIDICRVIWSTDAFESAAGTNVPWVAMGQTEFIVRDHTQITTAVARKTGVAWQNYQALWEKGESFGWLITALEHFYFSWRSSCIEQICLNLGITLETLFPHFLRGDHPFRTFGQLSDEREHMWNLIQRISSVRAAIVQGDMSDGLQDRMIEIAKAAFPFAASVLARVLLDTDFPRRPRTDVVSVTGLVH